MTETSCAIDLGKTIDEAPTGNLPAVADALGQQEKDVLKMNPQQVSEYRKVLRHAAKGYQAAVRLPVPENLSLPEQRQHLDGAINALNKLEAALVAANSQGPAVAQQSVLELCGYKRTETGSIICSRPETVTLIEIFEMANAECKRLGINPAVRAGDLAWWKDRTKTSAYRYLAGTEEVTGLLAGSLCKSRSDQEELAQKHGGLASIEMAALANVLEHIATRGAHDTFEGKVIVTKLYGFALTRYADGLHVRTHSERPLPHVGCAASRNLEAA